MIHPAAPIQRQTPDLKVEIMRKYKLKLSSYGWMSSPVLNIVGSVEKNSKLLRIYNVKYLFKLQDLVFCFSKCICKRHQLLHTTDGHKVIVKPVLTFLL